MNEVGLQKALRIYQLLVNLYPKKYQEEYAEQMSIVFKDLYKEYKIGNGKIDIYFWLRITKDTIISSMDQHTQNMHMNFIGKYSTPLTVTLTTFILTFLLVTTSIWLYSSFSIAGGGPGIKLRLKNFTTKYNDVIKNDVFNEIFKQAGDCVVLPTQAEIEKCRKAVGRKLGDTLHEEELAVKGGYGWPHDLFFVKQDGESFYQVGWDGELKNISQKVNKNQLTQKQPLWSVLLRHNCNYFHISPEIYGCEVYESINLDTATGYVVRIYPFEEENNFSFIVSMPLIVLMALPTILTQKGRSEDLIVAMVYVSPLMIPIIVSLIARHIYKRRKK